MRRILVTNDDGVDSDGIIILAERLRDLGEVTVVAPDTDRSGVSHSIATRHSVAVRAVEGRAVRTYACTGMPADCVVIGVNELCGGTPAMVVSGINRGANLADDINYSGTVAAAVEARLAGVPAIAVSLAASWPEHDAEHQWLLAARIAGDLARTTLDEPLPDGTFWNVNVPNVDPSRYAGTRITRQGRKRYSDRLAPDEHAGSYYYVWGNPERGSSADGTSDIEAVEANYASLTPLRIDRTDAAVFAAHTRART